MAKLFPELYEGRIEEIKKAVNTNLEEKTKKGGR